MRAWAKHIMIVRGLRARRTMRQLVLYSYLCVARSNTPSTYFPTLKGWRDSVPNCARRTRPFLGRAFREVRDATNKERHVCARRRDGESAVVLDPSRHPVQHFAPSVRQASARSLNPELRRLSYTFCCRSMSRSYGVFPRPSGWYPPLLRLGCRATSTFRTSVS